jgi:Cu(I)/Ag(I) efflux system membrane protein CusA/SilA
MRYGENPRAVIDRVKEKIASIEPELGGVKIRGIYDRTELVNETIATLTDVLTEEVLITIVVVSLFLLHVRASLVIAITLPMAVLMAFIAMNLFGVDANIMSLAGIAIAIGTMVDMGIIVLENIYGELAEWESQGAPDGKEGRLQAIYRSAAEVVPAVVTAVSTTVVSFLPVFFLTGRDHRLFAPLAWTKTFALVASLIVAVTVVPMLCRLFLRSGRPSRFRGLAAGLGFAVLTGGLGYFVWGEQVTSRLPVDRLWASVGLAVVGFLLGWWMNREKIRPIDESPVSRLVRFLYAGRLRVALRHKLAMLSLPAIVLLLGVGACFARWAPS